MTRWIARFVFGTTEIADVAGAYHAARGVSAYNPGEPDADAMSSSNDDDDPLRSPGSDPDDNEQSSARALSVHLTASDRRFTSERASWLTGTLIRAAGACEPSAGGELRIRVVGDEEMAYAHKQYSGVEGTTDVLTFDLNEKTGESPGKNPAKKPGRATPVDADALICIDVAEREAAVRGHPLERELLLYALHALLHCTGFDDMDDLDHARMHAEEDRILDAIGVGATYGAAEDGGGDGGDTR
jgi:probable rRNA maturation factor